MNEAVAGPEWPSKAERNQRLFNAAKAIKALLAAERVTTEGPPVLRDARLWCRPATAPLLVGAATSDSTAEWLGGWADGLLTVGRDVEALRSTIAAFRRGGGRGKSVFLKVDLSWAPSEAEAWQQAHDNWRFIAAPADANAELRQPEDFDAATRHLTAAALRSHVFISSDPQAHVAHLQAFASLGVEAIDLHQVGRDQEGFIDVFGAQVLPAMRRTA